MKALTAFLRLAPGFAIALSACSQAPSSVPSTNRSTAASRVRHNAAGTVTEYPIPTANSGPSSIIFSSDGAMWFSETTASQIGRITTTGSFSETPTPTSNAGPSILTNTDDSNFPIWFTENTTGAIALIAIYGGIIELPISKPPGVRPNGISPGPPGNEEVWFTNYQSGNSIGRVNGMGKIREYPLLGSNAFPAVIVAGPDKALWFTEQKHERIGRISLKGAIREFVIPAGKGSKPYGIVLGPDNALWFTLSGANAIGRITSKGKMTLYTVPTPKSVPWWIAVGPDNALWFTENAANQIGRIDPTTGAITEYPIPTSASCPSGITAGPDNAMWFTESCANNIGRITTS